MENVSELADPSNKSNWANIPVVSCMLRMLTCIWVRIIYSRYVPRWVSENCIQQLKHVCLSAK